MKCYPGRSRSNEGAIRKIDVLVVVAILFILGILGTVGLILPGRLKERALRTQCLGNLKQLGMSYQAYANDYKGLLPDCSRMNRLLAGPDWPWDMNTNLFAILATNGLTREHLYCPANPAMNTSTHWNFGERIKLPISVVGYGSLLNGMRSVPRNLWRTNIAGDEQTPPVATELSFDATASGDEDYTRITGVLVDRSNHVRNTTPLGGNVLFLDGHVMWRDFSEMQVRFNTTGTKGQILWSY